MTNTGLRLLLETVCASIVRLGALDAYTLRCIHAILFLHLRMHLAYHAVAATIGILSHVTIFITGEHHLEGPTWLNLFISVLSLSLIGQAVPGDVQLQRMAADVLFVIMSFGASLFTSIVVYRVFFHRLRSFPGPFFARITKFWHVWKVLRRSDNFRQLDRLHRKFGDFVRTGRHKNMFVLFVS